jgi:hypothetical protein
MVWIDRFTPQSLRIRLSDANWMGAGWVGRRVDQYPLEKRLLPCPLRKLNCDSAYFLRILQVEQRYGDCHFSPTHTLHLFTFPLRRLSRLRLQCPRKIEITPACRSVFAATLPCVLEGPSAHSHCRSTSSDVVVQTVQRDSLFPHWYSVARNPSPYRCNLRVQVFHVVFRSTSSLC